MNETLAGAGPDAASPVERRTAAPWWMFGLLMLTLAPFLIWWGTTGRIYPPFLLMVPIMLVVVGVVRYFASAVRPFKS